MKLNSQLKRVSLKLLGKVELHRRVISNHGVSNTFQKRFLNVSNLQENMEIEKKLIYTSNGKKGKCENEITNRNELGELTEKYNQHLSFISNMEYLKLSSFFSEPFYCRKTKFHCLTELIEVGEFYPNYQNMLSINISLFPCLQKIKSRRLLEFIFPSTTSNDYIPPLKFLSCLSVVENTNYHRFIHLECIEFYAPQKHLGCDEIEKLIKLENSIILLLEKVPNLKSLILEKSYFNVYHYNRGNLNGSIPKTIRFLYFGYYLYSVLETFFNQDIFQNFPYLEICIFETTNYKAVMNECQKYLFQLPKLLFVQFADCSFNFHS
jgi:hypothetical protein